jgi:hypothetical protein
MEFLWIAALEPQMLASGAQVEIVIGAVKSAHGASVKARFSTWRSKDMRRVLGLSCVLVASCSASLASGNPYEDAAKLEMEHLASSVLAASLCNGVHFNGDAVIPHLAAATLLLGQERAQEVFFSAMRASVDAMSVNGQEIWCAATIKAAKDRKSNLLSEDEK